MSKKPRFLSKYYGQDRKKIYNNKDQIEEFFVKYCVH